MNLQVAKVKDPWSERKIPEKEMFCQAFPTQTLTREIPGERQQQHNNNEQFSTHTQVQDSDTNMETDTDA